MKAGRLPLAPGLRVGLFGGSFDPVHAGHLHVAETARRRLGLERVVWLVSPGNPLKASASAGLEQRMAGVRKALAGDPAMIASDVEARLGVRYSIDTLTALKAANPGVRFVWIMGSDSLADFHRWRDWQAIARLMPVAVVARPGSLLAPLHAPFARRFAAARVDERQAASLPDRAPPAWVFLHGPLNALSSTALRESGR